MKKLIYNKHFYYMLFIDAVLVTVSYIVAYLLRYEGQLPAEEWLQITHTLPYLLAVKLTCFALFGLYRGMWRYTSLEDVKSVVKATVVSSLILVLAVLYIYHFQGYSRAAFIIDWLLTILYFMSIPEAAQLILQAGARGQGGEVFILDMGKPVKIVDMARDVIRLHGFEPDRDIPIEYIGLRPGEKLYEELITVGEGIMPTSHEKIKVIQGNHGDFQILNTMIDELIHVADTFDAEGIKRKLREIVPEYIPYS